MKFVCKSRSFSWLLNVDDDCVDIYSAYKIIMIMTVEEVIIVMHNGA
jgi:hypothetical protein